MGKYLLIPLFKITYLFSVWLSRDIQVNLRLWDHVITRHNRITRKIITIIQSVALSENDLQTSNCHGFNQSIATEQMEKKSFGLISEGPINTSLNKSNYSLVTVATSNGQYFLYSDHNK